MSFCNLFHISWEVSHKELSERTLSLQVMVKCLGFNTRVENEAAQARQLQGLGQ